MHSSRMRTGRSLTVCRGAPAWGGCLLPGGGCLLPGGGCLLPRESVLLQWVCLPRGGRGAGCLLLGDRGSVCFQGVSASGGCLPVGVSAFGPAGVCFWSWGVYIPAGNGADTPCGQTHTCQNINLATTSLRPVKNYVTIMFHKMVLNFINDSLDLTCNKMTLNESINIS